MPGRNQSRAGSKVEHHALASRTIASGEADAGDNGAPGVIPHRSRSELARDALLDAAEAVILRESIGRLTLEAVALEAGASKGGLLHHFPSKERLIEALVGRIVANWRADVLAAIAAQPPGPGRLPRAMIGMSLAPAEFHDQCRRSSTVLMAALVNCPAQVQPMRDFHKELAKMIARDGLPPGVGEAAVLALDGLWFKWIFGLEEIGGTRMRAVSDALTTLIDDAIARTQSRGATKTRSVRGGRPSATRANKTRGARARA